MVKSMSLGYRFLELDWDLHLSVQAVDFLSLTMTHLGPFNTFADVVEIMVMVVLMIVDVVTYVRNRPYLVAFTNFSIIPYGVGVAIYAFEGIGMVVPLETMADKKHRFSSILGLALIFITVVYGAFGLLGYCAFGSETKDIITLKFGRIC